MNRPVVTIGADHAGWTLKELVRQELLGSGHEVLDRGTNSDESVDYPDFARLVADDIVTGRAERGVLICGTGIGMSIAANRHSGVRAALCHDVETASLAREHNNANILVMGARFLSEDLALDCLRAFLTTQFAGGRHDRRLAKIS